MRFFAVLFTTCFITQVFSDKKDNVNEILTSAPPFISFENRMPVMHFVVINRSKRISDSLLKQTIKAIEIQTKRDFAPYYGISAQFECAKNVSKVNWRRNIPIFIVDNGLNTCYGKLAIHSNQGPSQRFNNPIDFYTKSGIPELPEGTPYAIILMGSKELGYGIASAIGNPEVFPNDFEGLFTSTASHEILEILGNYQNSGFIVKRGEGEEGRNGYDFFTHDVCNPVANSAYKINGLFMQDFVLPSYWDYLLKKGPFDFMNTVTAPLTPFKGFQTFLNFFHSAQEYYAAEHYTLRSNLRNPTTLTLEREEEPIFNCYFEKRCPPREVPKVLKPVQKTRISL